MCVERAFVCLDRVVSLGVRRSAAFRLAWCMGGAFFVFVGRVVSLGVQRSVWRGVCGAWLVEIAMNLVDRKTRLWIARA